MSVVSGFTILLLGLVLTIGVVDMREMRIPDALNGLLLAGGLMFWLSSASGELPSQIGSASALAIILWLVRFSHFKTTGRMGLGLGDVKMAGAGAVWINPLLLPLFVFAASACGLIYVLIIAKKDRTDRVPFAPFLSIGLVCCWITEHFL
jgi:leader peptidase (prepilin peptidase) / N-methyltransferase